MLSDWKTTKNHWKSLKKAFKKPLQKPFRATAHCTTSSVFQTTSILYFLCITHNSGMPSPKSSWEQKKIEGSPHFASPDHFLSAFLSIGWISVFTNEGGNFWIRKIQLSFCTTKFAHIHILLTPVSKQLPTICTYSFNLLRAFPFPRFSERFAKGPLWATTGPALAKDETFRRRRGRQS